MKTTLVYSLKGAIIAGEKRHPEKVMREIALRNSLNVTNTTQPIDGCIPVWEFDVGYLGTVIDLPGFVSIRFRGCNGPKVEYTGPRTPPNLGKTNTTQKLQVVRWGFKNAVGAIRQSVSHYRTDGADRTLCNKAINTETSTTGGTMVDCKACCKKADRLDSYEVV